MNNVPAAHVIRTIEMQLVYAMLLGGNERELTLSMLAEDQKITDNAREKILTCMSDLDELTPGIDLLVDELAKGWSVDHLPRVELAILRLGIYEMLYRAETVPAAVTINECVELTKTFSSEESAAYVNGILSTCLKKRDTGELTCEIVNDRARVRAEELRQQAEEKAREEAEAEAAKEKARREVEDALKQDQADSLLDTYDRIRAEQARKQQAEMNWDDEE